MKQNLLAFGALVASATSSFAGSIAYIPPEVTAIEEPSRMGGSGAWIIPLVIASVLFLAFFKPNQSNPNQIADAQL